MARTPRQASESEWHHVMNRGARRLPVFGDDVDRKMFLGLLGDATQPTRFEVHGYALMDNHYHLLVRSPVADLSEAMRVIGGSYTRRFNDRYGLDGPLYRGRYRSIGIDSDRYLHEVLRYIHRNPLEDSDGDRRPRVFRWTSHLAYAGLSPPPRWLTFEPLRRAIGDKASYRAFIEGGDGLDAHDFLGDEPPRRTTAASLIESAVGVASPPERALLRGGARGVRNHQRLACILLCREVSPMTAQQLASRYGFQNTGALRTALSRARALISTNEDFAAIVEAARIRLAIERL